MRSQSRYFLCDADPEATMNSVADSSGTAPASEADEAARGKRAALLELAVVGLVIVAVVVSIVGARLYLHLTVQREFREDLADLAVKASRLVDAQLHQRIRLSEHLDNPDYRLAVAPLQRMKRATPEIRYIYTLVRDGERVRFVLDAAAPGDSDQDGIEDRSGVWEEYAKAPEAAWLALGADGRPGIVNVTRKPYRDRWGEFVSAYAPVFDATGRQIAVVGVDMDASIWHTALVNAGYGVSSALLPVSLIILGHTFVAWRMRRRWLSETRRASIAVSKAKHAAYQVHRAQQHLNNVIDSTGVGLWELNVATGDVTVNAHWAAMLGYTLEELSPLTLERCKALVHPDDLARVNASTRATIDGVESQHEGDQRMRHKDGRWIWVAVQGCVVERGADGRPLLLAAAHRDISSRKAMESELSHAAHSDKLTGLANRPLLMERLASAVVRVRPDSSRASRCCFSTSIISSSSTTRWAMKPGTTCCGRSRCGCAPRCATPMRRAVMPAATWWRASAATSSSS